MSHASSAAVVKEERSDLREILRLVADDLAHVEGLLHEHVSTGVRLLDMMASYVQDGGGKRIRPALLLLAAGLCGARGERPRWLAAAVEYIHMATLLHDDVIDSAAMRRGRRSANNRWGNAATVLLGDFLYARSMALALTQQNLPILRLLSEATLGMVEGEILEIERRGDGLLSETDYLRIIERKTARFFSACAEIGAILGGVPPAQRRALAAYGLELGICFQIVDDMLDFVGDERILGKPVANDLREGNLTLPAIHLLASGDEEASRKVLQVLKDRGYARVPREEILRLAHKHGSIDAARRQAEARASVARRRLDVFSRSPHRQALQSIPDFVLERVP
ncbi:MAG: polyprenyl synthetase family protein [Vicinamibacteria bacterium]|nr:polyprenyl synthetase family protein [Vicinamibacteria bacterium]